MELNEYGEARRDLLSAAKLEPSNQEVRRKLAQCRDAAQVEKAKEQAMYAAMLQVAGLGIVRVPHATRSCIACMRESS